MLFKLIFSKWFLALLSLMKALDGTYTILPESRVFIQGTSNVNHFTCDCSNEFEVRHYKVFQSSPSQMVFVDTKLYLPVTLFDCKNRKMDRDLQRALKADQYPTVELELTNLHISSSNLSQLEDQWAEATAKVNITLAGVTKTQFVRVKVKRADSSALQIDGSKSLKMTDFEITPPEVLFGMIKVNDQITLHFNLNVQIV